MQSHETVGQGLLLKRLSYWICRGFYGNPSKQRTLSIQANAEDILEATVTLENSTLNEATTDRSLERTFDGDSDFGGTGSLNYSRKRQRRPGNTLDETLETTLGDQSYSIVHSLFIKHETQFLNTLCV